MDPVLEALRFGVAILAGGIVAVIAQRIAFRHAQKLQRDDQAYRDAALRRALLAEIEQNAVALEPFARGTATLEPVPRLHRDAWVAAHSVAWPRQKFLSIGALYVTIDGYGGLREMIVSREVGGTQVLHLRMQAQTVGKTALELVEGAKKATS